MNQEIIVGLDIGTTKICSIVGKKNQFGKLDVLGMGKAVSEGVIKGIVTNIDKTVYAIEKAVKQAGDQANIDIRSVNVGIAGQHIKSAVHHGSITRKSNDEITVEDVNRLSDDMYRIVITPGSEIIHVMPQDYIVDYDIGIKDPVGMSGVRLEADFHIITAQNNAISNIHRCIKRAGLKIENLILEPLASSLAVLSEEEREAGVCLIDIGGGTTDIAIFHENIIRHSAVIPFGGDIITADIKQGLKLMENQAEALKTKFGRAIAEEASSREVVSIKGLRNRPPKEVSVKSLASIIEARMEEIIEMVHTEIITSGYHKKLAAGIVITGGGSQLANIQQIFEYMTGQDTRIGYPNEHLGKSRVESAKTPMFATSVGLVLSGFKALDFRQAQYMKRAEQLGGAKKKRTKSDGGFFQNILDKTKNLLIDDVDDKQEY